MRMAARRSMTTSTSTWNFEERKRTDGPFFSRYFNTNAAHQRSRKKKLKQEETKRKKIKIKIKYLVVFSSVVFVPFAFHSGVYLFKRCWCSLPCDFASFLCKAFGRRRRRATQTPNMYREMWGRFTEYIRIY